MTETVEAVIRAAPIFSRVTPEDCARLASVARVSSYVRNGHVFEEGDEPAWLYSIVSGHVKVVKTTPGGADIILEIFGPGDPLGAVAAYEGRPYPATAVAMDEVRCLQVPRREFFALLDSHPTLVRGLLTGLTWRLVELTNRVAELTRGRMEPRFARLLLKLADDSGKPSGTDVVIPVPLTRQELADLAGTTVETAIRIMSRWAKQGLVTTESAGFRLHDREALERRAIE